MLKQKGESLIGTLLTLTIFIVLPAIVAGGMAITGYQNTADALAAAEAFGFKNPKVVNTYRWISASTNGCGYEWKATKMTAINPTGKEVSITVCEGAFFKGATIRH